MAVSDAIFPVLTTIDSSLLGWAPPYGRIIVWGLLSGSLTMTIYWAASPQGRIAALKKQIKSHQASGALQSDDFGEVMRASLTGLGLSLRVFGLALGASLLSGLPILAVIFWISATYGLATPSPGDRIAVDAYADGEAADPASIEVRRDDGRKPRSLADGFIWPSPDTAVTLQADNMTIFQGRFDTPGPGQLHVRQWWNVLIGNELGYLSSGSAVDQIDFHIPRRSLADGLPGWMATWEFPFFLTTVLVSVAIKFGFRIH